MKLIFAFVISLLLLINFVSCDTSEPLPKGAVGLSLDDVSCTEAWITLTAGNLSNTAYIRITGNGKLLETLDVNSVKTALYIDTLQPNTSYEFQAFSSQRGEEIVGNKLQFTTLDTTSHNFTWQTFEFGQHSSSTLYDVAIINENDIWAVGEIYMNDSLGNPDPVPYNTIHWNGTDWELKKIKYLVNGSYIIPVIHSVFSFGKNDIWFDSFIRWDGTSFKDIPFTISFSHNINKLWGVNSSDLYAVGDEGNIAHFDGIKWTKVQTLTDYNFNDISGYKDQYGSEIILTVANKNYISKIFSVNNFTIIDTLDWNNNTWINSCWINKYKLYVCGRGIWKYVNNSWSAEEGLPDYNYKFIRGSGANNLFVIDSQSHISHFNGLSWEMYDQSTDYFFESISTGEKVVAVTGNYQGRALIKIGRRN